MTSPLYHGIGSFSMARGMMGYAQWGLTLRAVMLSVQLQNRERHEDKQLKILVRPEINFFVFADVCISSYSASYIRAKSDMQQDEKDY